MKLTLISISFRGRTISRFVHMACINGRAIASAALVNSMLDELGVRDGQTFSIA